MSQHHQTHGQRAQPYRRSRHDPRVEQLAARYGEGGRAILPILQGLTDGPRPFGRETLGAVADRTHTQDAHVAGLASFYSMFAEESGAPSNGIRVCDGPVCTLHGAEEIRQTWARAVPDGRPECVGRTSCLGLCDRAPAALVGLEPCGPLSAARADSIQAGWRGGQPSYAAPIVGEQRVAMGRIGKVDPNSYASAFQHGAYRVVQRVLSQAVAPNAVLQEVAQSGLRGCGGAGYPTGQKWQLVAEADADAKYVICNADESEPGAFKDRVLIEGDPHRVLEGMLLAAYAVGATTGVIYIRGEYEQQAQLLERAIGQAREAGWLGDSIASTPFSFDVQVHRGAGAYICGEETALLDSLEGRRGEPRLRPPFPSTHGYLGRPTVVNNVETLCMVPDIVLRGAAWYRNLGPLHAPGTKVFTLSGHARRCAAFESTLGITLRDILNRIGLGMRSGSRFKMALTGGAAGTFVPPALLDTPIDFESTNRGVALGSGVVILFDTSVSTVSVLEGLLRFFRRESCGKCTPCREGTYVAHQIVQRIAGGAGRAGDLADLRHLGEMLHATSLCGLGRSVALPILSALDSFGEDFKKCGAT